VKPGGDILPVKARLSHDRQWDMLVAQIDGGEALWMHLGDVVNSKLATGGVPRIDRAITITPVGWMPELISMQLRGTVEVDPRRPDDLFRVSVEERERCRKGGTAEGKRTEKFLKGFGNTIGYGKFVEYRRRDLPKGESERVQIYGRHAAPFARRRSAPEDPGPWCYPPIGSAVTGSARLLLGVIEALVRRRGGEVAYRDTDSVFVVSTTAGGPVACPGGPLRLPTGQPAVQALSWDDVDAVVNELDDLNPFDRTVIPGSVVKVEKENFDPLTKQRREIQFLGLASKSYALYTDLNGRREIVKASDFGLGHLRNPTLREAGAEEDDAEDLDTLTPFGRLLWEYVLGLELGQPGPEPPWLDLPAVGKLSLSTPRTILPFERYNGGRRYADQIKPHGFGLTCYPKDGGAPARSTDKRAFHLVGPFETDPARWRSLSWFDLYTGERYRIRTGDVALAVGNVCVVKSYREVLEAFRTRPELKLADAEGQPCAPGTRGMLRRRAIWVIGITHIGRETNDLDDREAGVTDLDQALEDFGDGDRDDQELVRLALAGVPPRARARGVGDRQKAERFFSKGTRLHHASFAILREAALQHARTSLRGWGMAVPRDDLDTLTVFITERDRRGGARRCQCGRWLGGRKTWCSERCRKRCARRRRSIKASSSAT